ncbi:hypothetical protein [Saccharopolyspora sp. NPDC049357]|uniref:hypothetical protein n=1 Tax=Saccharopolyspora sp. NPDC049357 TaxID=3154507 RepID=UPI00342EFF8F
MTRQPGLERRYAELIMLVRHHLALDDQGSYADGTDPDNVLFAKVWVRARMRHAVRPGVITDVDIDR